VNVVDEHEYGDDGYLLEIRDWWGGEGMGAFGHIPIKEVAAQARLAGKSFGSQVRDIRASEGYYLKSINYGAYHELRVEFEGRAGRRTITLAEISDAIYRTFLEFGVSFEKPWTSMVVRARNELPEGFIVGFQSDADLTKYIMMLDAAIASLNKPFIVK
jgi:hypothetical protein